MDSPNLDIVRNRRRRIWSMVSSLCEEDRELYTAEKVLLRLSGTSEKPSHPLTVLPPQMGTASADMNALLTSASYGITTRLHPGEFTDLDLIEAERAFAETEEEEDDFTADENDGGKGLVDLVQSVMSGNESLEQLTLLLFRNCGDVWWTANEIQDYLQRIKGKEVPMNSISPMLTALKNAGVIAREGHNVALTDRTVKEALR
jgi:hypothetical protein